MSDLPSSLSHPLYPTDRPIPLGTGRWQLRAGLAPSMAWDQLWALAQLFTIERMQVTRDHREGFVRLARERARACRIHFRTWYERGAAR